MTWALNANLPATRHPFVAANPILRQSLILLVTVSAAVGGFLATGPDAISLAATTAGADLTRLLRFMAALKGMMAVVALAAVMWRLGAAVTPLRLATYGIAAAAMAAGPGLIWGMVHLKLGAALLHGGLFATIILLWRDPAVAGRLETMIRARRRR